MRAPLFFVTLFLGGCSSNMQEHAPLADEECREPPCASGIGVTGGSAGAAGSSIVDGGTVALGGIVGVFTDAEFIETAPFSGTGTIGVFGAAGPPNQASGTFTGSTYVIDAAPVSSVLWADLEAPSSPAVMPTLIAIAGNSTAASAVAFAQTSVMTQIFTELTRSPQTMRPSAAQLVVKFVNLLGAPLSGVTITLAPQGSDVAYDVGTLYSDLSQVTAIGTGSRGVALVLNADAAAWPGALAAVSFRYGTPAVVGTVEAYIAGGAVTVVTVSPSQ